ncbi:hypothetical protein HK405_006227 [Cladochytrium tenue]|nr:hypothetical protein HK405_006227 [Cladochytrium tenue]
MFAYEPQQPDEMTLAPGDDVIVWARYDDGWATGENLTTGRIGMFPLTCLDGEGMAAEDGGGGAPTVVPFVAPVSGPVPTAAATPRRVRRVKFDYEPQRPDEMTLAPGDDVIVSVSYDDGWATGENLTTGRIGTFPLTNLNGDGE